MSERVASSSKPRARSIASGRACLVAALAPVLALGCDRTASDEAVGAGGPPYASTRAPLVLPAGEVGFLSNAYSDTVDVFRMNPMEKLGSFPVGRVPIDTDGASHIALDKNAGALYVALPYPGMVAAIAGPHASHASSERPGYVQKVGTTDFRDQGSVRVDVNPADMALSDDGRRLVVSHFDLSRATSKGLPPEERNGAIVTIDTTKHFTDPSLAAPRLRVCRAPHGLALSPGAGQFAFVACYADDAIAKVNLDTKEITLKALGPALNETDVPRIGPYAIALSPSATKLALGTTEGKSVQFIDAGTLAPIGAAVGVGGAAYFPAWSADEAQLFVPTQSPDTLQVVNVATGQVSMQRTFTNTECDKPHAVRVSKDGARLFVVCEGDRKQSGALLALDASTLQITARQLTGVYPDRIATMDAP